MRLWKLVYLPTYIKQTYTFKKESNHPFEGMKKERENQLSTILFYFTSFLLSIAHTDWPLTNFMNHISSDNVRPLSHTEV